MAAMHEGAGAPEPASPDLTTPNQYHLHGAGISVAYFPEGFGPVTPGRPGRFIYQDAQRSLSFQGEQIRTVELPDLGLVVSVTLVLTVDVGSTTFSVLLPQVVLPAQGQAASVIHTEGITTIHHTFLAPIGHAQREVYSVTPLRGTAARGILPL